MPDVMSMVAKFTFAARAPAVVKRISLPSMPADENEDGNGKEGRYADQENPRCCVHSESFAVVRPSDSCSPTVVI
jgi:hypothetical protein